MKSRPHPLLAASAAALVLGSVARTQALPSDPFVGASPQLDARPPDASDHDDGDWGVAEQTGAASYTVPIVVPPGRHGMQPALALRYSSAGALRGGLAAGWSLELPAIELDRTSLNTSSLRYTASLGGSSGRLVPTGETPFVAGAVTYRLELDDGFVRFEYLSTGRPGWVAITTDGVRHYFDESVGAFDAQRRWMLTEQLDRWGNSTRYTWTAVDAGRQLAAIDYGASATAGLAAHARVELAYVADGACPGATTPIGATVEWDRPRAGLAGNGRHVKSPRRLVSITTKVKDTPSSSLRAVRTYNLGYDGAARSCSQAAAPLRYLTSIAVTGHDAAGVATAAPPVSFEYNRQKRLFDTTGSAAFVNPTEAGTQHGANFGLVDVNGDGIRDQAWVFAATDGKCTMAWQRGLRGGGFTQLRAITWALPTASWTGGTLPGSTERCTFTGQITYKRNITIPNNGCPNRGSIIGYRFLDWDRDGLDDLVATVWHDEFYDPSADPPLNGGSAFQSDDGPAPPDNHCDSARVAEGSGLTRTVLRVHRNTGSGFNPQPTRVYNYAPVAVPPPGSDGALATSQLSAHSIPVLTDLNGDGFQDIIDTNSALALGLSTWRVYLGSPDAPGGLEVNLRYWTLPSFTVVSGGTGKSKSGDNALFWQSTTAVLRDVSGDGLPDLLVQHAGTRTFTFPPGNSTRTIGPDVMVAFLNTGDGFASEPMPMASTGAFDITQTNVWQYGSAGNFVDDGAQGARRRLVDVDADGLVDLLVQPGSTTNPYDGDVWSVSFGTGDSFGPTQSFTPPGATGRRAQRRMTVTDRAWRVWSDLTDVNGDGLADLAEWTSAGVVWRTETAAPMRLLTRVRNGRGAVVDYSYVPSSDRGVVSWAHSAARLPGVRWVVRQIAIDAGSAQPTQSTRYDYAEPTYGSPTGRASDPARFLGFAGVTRETAGGARTVTRYTYNVPGAGPIGRDASGRQESVASWSWDATQSRWELLGYATTGWQAESVMAGKSAFVHRTTALDYTCPADTTELTMPVCTAAIADARRTSETWAPISCQSNSACMLGSPTFVWVRTTVEEGRGATTGADSRRTLTTNEIRAGKSPYTAADYRILPIATERQAWVVSGWQPVGRAETVYDTTGNIVTAKKLLAGTTYATTTHTYDATGNPISSRGPAQQPSGPVSTATYDAHRLFVITTTNELGHTSRATYDVGSGQRTRADGPNTGCSGACGEHQIFKLDGLGRARERWAGMGVSYTPTLVEKVTYTDGIPSRVKSEKLVDVGGAAWVTSERELDGLGRPVRETRPVPGKPAAVTRWRYDAGGGLAALDTPDPRVDSGATLTSTFTRDGAGRATGFRRPDGSGINVSYDGRRESRRDHTADGSGGEIVYRRDVHGRLVEVRQGEINAANASTLYTYDAADRLVQVTNADNQVTTMTHDLGGRRTTITRGARSWVASYDAEDRVTALRSPLPAGALATDYTTTMTYDVLGRVLVRTPARRGKNAADLAALGIGPVVHAYDSAPNGKGRPASITAQRFGGGPFVAVTTVAYEERGLVAAEYQQVMTTDPIAISAATLTTRTYNALGQLVETDLGEGGRTRRVYDATGAVVKVERWTGSAWTALATYDRALAGVPRTRSGPGGQVRTFGYDSAGRVLTDVVAAGATMRASTTYAYFDDGDLERVSGTTGGLAVFGDYAYDALGQVTFAQGPNGRYQAFEYSPAGNLTGVSSNETGIDRSFDYAYAGADPQAVTSIVDAATSAAHASFVYDAAGNATQRTTPLGGYDLTWDGEDVLRASKGPSGREVYLYDGAGGRVASVGATGARVWIGDQELQVASGGAVTKRYAHVSDGGQVVARVENGATVELQYADMLQNLALALDPGGNVTAAFSYGPFGDLVAQVGEATHRRQFNGKEHDAATGLRYYGARFYDPVARRWMSADPKYRFTPDVNLGQPLRHNLYAFSLNNPVRYHDPDGQDPPFKADKEVAHTFVDKSTPLGDYGGKAEFKLQFTEGGVTAQIGFKTFEAKLAGDYLTIQGPGVEASGEAGWSGVAFSAKVSLGGVKGDTGTWCFVVCLGAEATAEVALGVEGKLGTSGAKASVGFVGLEDKWGFEGLEPAFERVAGAPEEMPGWNPSSGDVAAGMDILRGATENDPTHELTKGLCTEAASEGCPGTEPAGPTEGCGVDTTCE